MWMGHPLTPAVESKSSISARTKMRVSIAIELEFPMANNEVEYEAVLAGLGIAK
jgi:ribonuclease HI